MMLTAAAAATAKADHELATNISSIVPLVHVLPEKNINSRMDTTDKILSNYNIMRTLLHQSINLSRLCTKQKA